MDYNHIPNMAWTLKTGTNDLSGNQYHGVKIDAQGAAKVAAITDNVVGFQTDNPTAANQYVALESNGIVLAEAGAAVTVGLQVAIMADGKIKNAEPTIVIAGTPAENDVYTATINGVAYSFTALATPTVTSVADGLVALIDAASDISADNTAGVITVTPDSANVNISALSTDSTAGTITLGAVGTVVGNALKTGVSGNIVSIKLKNM